MIELQLQSECYIWFHNTFPTHRGRLYHNFQNPKNKIQGSQLKAIGLVAGVADFTFISNPMVYIELKVNKRNQSKAQKKFQFIVESFGHNYYICRSLDQFKELIPKILDLDAND